MPDSARAKIRGQWAGPHRRGDVVPELDSQLQRSVNSPRSSRMPWSGIPTCRPPPRASRPRAHAVRVAASSLYPRIAMKGLGERQGREIGGNQRGSASTRPISADSAESLTKAAAPPTRATSTAPRNAGSMASASALRGRPMCGVASARARRPRRPRATRSRRTTNLPANRSPPRWRAPISRPSKPRSRKPTRRRRSAFTRNTRSSPTCAKSRATRATTSSRR